MAIKSVPPDVASANRHRATATAFSMPPNTAESRGSYRLMNPTNISGIKSVISPLSTTISTEYMVNFFPTVLKQMTAGTALSTNRARLKGMATPRNPWKISCARIATPVKPPGIRPPARTKVFRLKAMSAAPSTISVRRRAVRSAGWVCMEQFMSEARNFQGLVRGICRRRDLNSYILANSRF